MEGHKINFSRKPKRGEISNANNSYSIKLQKCINENLENRLIEEVSKVGVISHLFLKQKSDNKFRMILNLQQINKFVTYQHFKMETFNDTKKYY